MNLRAVDRCAPLPYQAINHEGNTTTPDEAGVSERLTGTAVTFHLESPFTGALNCRNPEYAIVPRFQEDCPAG